MSDAIESLDNFKQMLTQVVEQALADGGSFCERKFIAKMPNGKIARCPMTYVALQHPKRDEISKISAASQILNVPKNTIWEFIAAFDHRGTSYSFVNEQGQIEFSIISEEMSAFALAIHAKIGDKLYNWNEN